MNEHEMEARTRKAQHLADVLWRAGCTAPDALELSDEAWGKALETANVAFEAKHKYPSSETKAMVISILEDRAQLDGLFDVEDPLAGLPTADSRPVAIR